MKKQFLAIILALILCLGLAVPAFAVDAPATYEEAFKNVTLSYPLGDDVNGGFTHYPSVETALTFRLFDIVDGTDYFDTLTSYHAMRKDTTFTLTFNKTAEEDNSYIRIYITPFVNIGDGIYESPDWPHSDYLTNSGEFIPDYLAPFEFGGLVELKAGESVQFTPHDYDDAVYCLKFEKWYPDTAREVPNEWGGTLTVMDYSWRSAYFKVDDAAVDAYLRTGFDDVPYGAYYADPVAWAVKNDITVGTDDHAFSPDETCSRAQILTFLWRAADSPEPTSENPFTDIVPDDYYYKAALWAAEQGMVSGSDFGAETPCTRAATVEYLWKAAGGSTPSGAAGFADVPDDADYAAAVAWAAENHVTEGTGVNTFSPDDTCSRGQIVTFLYRMWGE